MVIGEHSVLPEVLAQLRSDNSAIVVFNGSSFELQGQDLTDTRAQALHYITGLAAQIVDGPVQVALTDPDGTGWRLVVTPEGDVTEEAPARGGSTMTSTPATSEPDESHPPDQPYQTAPTAQSAEDAVPGVPSSSSGSEALPAQGNSPFAPPTPAPSAPSSPAADADAPGFVPGTVTHAFRGSEPGPEQAVAPPPASAPPSQPQHEGVPGTFGAPTDGIGAQYPSNPAQSYPGPVDGQHYPAQGTVPPAPAPPGAPGYGQPDPQMGYGQPAAAPPGTAMDPAQSMPTAPAQPHPGHPGHPGIPPAPGHPAAPHHQGGEEHPVPRRRDLRESFLRTEQAEAPAQHGLRGALSRIGIRTSPSEAERAERADINAVSQHWPGVRTIAVVNGKGGANKTPTTALLAAIFARNSGSATLAWDNNETRGTLGWRTEQGKHEATVQDLLPQGQALLDPTAKAGDISHFVHHQAADKYDVLRSNPNVLSAEQRITGDDVDLVHDVAGRYYRLIFIDSGNDESADHWLRMIDKADQLVVATIAKPEHAEAGALLLEALAQRDEHSARLAQNAVVVVSQAREKDTNPSAKQIADGFTGWVRDVVTIPFDRAMVESVLHFDSLNPTTQRAWLRAGAAVAAGL